MEELIAKLKSIQVELAQKAPFSFFRYLYQDLDIGNRLNILIGARGVGKTTLLLQKYKHLLIEGKTALYLSADSTFLAPFSLFEIGEYFYQQGGKYLLVDEVHFRPNWPQEIKTLYDSFPDLKLFLTGSASIKILFLQFDLSRRSRIYKLRGLSFREFLNLSLKKKLPPLTSEQIFKNHQEKAVKVKKTVEEKGGKIHKLFREYLLFGYYPFFLEGADSFSPKLENATYKVLYEDIPTLFSLKIDSINTLKKILALVATSSPFTVNIERLSRSLGVSKKSVYHFLEILQKSDLLMGIKQANGGYKSVRKPEKLYLGNTNLYPIFTGRIEQEKLIGSLRECFFFNQASKVLKVNLDRKVDFLVDENYQVEIGGKSKKSKGKGIWTVKDSIEIGIGKTIPLYLFGMLY